MTEPLTKVPIGLEGFTYLKSQLASGKSLSRALLQREDLDRGRLFAFLPPEFPRSKVLRLTESATIAAAHVNPCGWRNDLAVLVRG